MQCVRLAGALVLAGPALRPALHPALRPALALRPSLPPSVPPSRSRGTWLLVLIRQLRAQSQLEGFSIGEEDCGMMGGNCGQRLFSTRPNRVSLTRAPACGCGGGRHTGADRTERSGQAVGCACGRRAWLSAMRAPCLSPSRALPATACLSSCTRCVPVLPLAAERSAGETRRTAPKVCARTARAAHGAVWCGSLHALNVLRARCCWHLLSACCWQF